MLMFQHLIDFVISVMILILSILYQSLSLNLGSFPMTFSSFMASFEIFPWTWLDFFRYFSQIVLKFMEGQDCPF
jgi:hypothetical protein